MSPTRLTTNAFLAAVAATGLYCQNPISRYDARPTPSQPTKEHQVVVGEDEQQHRGDEKVEESKEAAPALVVRHVANGIDMDQAADAGDQQHKDDRELIDEQPDIDLPLPAGDPVVQRHRDGPRPARRGRADSTK